MTAAITVCIGIVGKKNAPMPGDKLSFSCFVLPLLNCVLNQAFCRLSLVPPVHMFRSMFPFATMVREMNKLAPTADRGSNAVISLDDILREITEAKIQVHTLCSTQFVA